MQLMVDGDPGRAGQAATKRVEAGLESEQDPVTILHLNITDRRAQGLLVMLKNVILKDVQVSSHTIRICAMDIIIMLLY